MDPTTWVKAKDSTCVGVEVGATICVILLVALLVAKTSADSYEFNNEAAVIDVLCAILRG